MTIKFSIIFCLVFCLALCGMAVPETTAQTGDKVIIGSGKNSLRQTELNQLIEFYEWLFAVRFTNGEREQFQEFVAADFRQNAATARKNANEVLAAFAKVRTLDADGQDKTREIVAPDFIAELRQSESDPDTRFLLDIYERGQNGNGAEGETTAEVRSNEDANDSLNPSGAASSSLVGRWVKKAGAGGSRDNTGKTLYNNGNDLIFEFSADGTMHFINDKNTLSITQCRITEKTSIPGRYTVSGGTVTMNLGVGTSVGTSSCESSGNFKKNLSASSLQKQFVVKRMESIFRPDKPWILCFDGSKDEDCFEKSTQ
jgi:hypothetical protein